MKVQSPPKSERCPGGLLAADGADSGRADAFESGEAAGGGGPAGVLPHAPHPATRCFQSRYPGGYEQKHARSRRRNRRRVIVVAVRTGVIVTAVDGEFGRRVDVARQRQ